MVEGTRLPVRTIGAITQMTPARQFVVVKLMCACNNFGGDFARALLSATPRAQMIASGPHKRSGGDRARRFAGAECQLLEMLERAKNLATGYNIELVYLAVAGSAVRSWLLNDDVVAWIASRYPMYLPNLMRLAGNADEAKEAKRPMTLPYGRERVIVPKKKLTEKRN
ncbi:hypothetical protein P3T43_004583 [Paraburkholderia sp. GAS41]|jgi:hypothetical protein|uniref:hypothetical protein n=1 Tax=Paraburkholderia sp. GAS41 TaxID=3035134 RepID=UPI003D1B7C3A